MFYYCIYFLITPLLYLFLHFLKFFNQKIYIHLKNEKVTFKKVKNKLKHIDRTNTKVLIFHAASAGEYEQIKPILNKIDKSKYFIIQTFSS